MSIPEKKSSSVNSAPVSFFNLKVTSVNKISVTPVSLAVTPEPVMFSPSSSSKSKASAKPESSTFVNKALVPARKRIASFSLDDPRPTIVMLVMFGAEKNPESELFPISVLKPSPSIPLS